MEMRATRVPYRTRKKNRKTQVNIVRKRKTARTERQTRNRRRKYKIRDDKSQVREGANMKSRVERFFTVSSATLHRIIKCFSSIL